MELKWLDGKSYCYTAKNHDFRSCMMRFASCRAVEF